MSDGSEYITRTEAQAMIDAAIKTEKDRLAAELAPVLRQLQRFVLLHDRQIRPRHHKPPPKRDGIDNLMSVLTFGVW